MVTRSAPKRQGGRRFPPSPRVAFPPRGLCGLTWADVHLDDVDDAEITFAWQVDRKGTGSRPRPTALHEPCRFHESSSSLALILVRHKLAVRDVRPNAFVFATCSGRALSQRNVARALREAQQRATDEHGQPLDTSRPFMDDTGRS